MESTGREPEEFETPAEGEVPDADAADEDVAGEGLAPDEDAADEDVAGEGAIPDEPLVYDDDVAITDDTVYGEDHTLTDDLLEDINAEDSDFEEREVVVPVRPRKAPRYGAFIGGGVIFGILLALVLFFFLPSDGSSSSLTGLFYLMILVTPFTALLGALAAVLFERRTLRK
ncbi:MAG TPA: hypothetical protein VK096_07005 [Actinomycetales bacterium]|nr:hypothetical protein [Actinomycetales bacterium]